MTDVDDEGVGTIGQTSQLVVHHLESRAAGRPDIDVNRPAREYVFQPPGDDLPDGKPGMIWLAPAARFADHQEPERVVPDIGIGWTSWKLVRQRSAACLK